MVTRFVGSDREFVPNSDAFGRTRVSEPRVIFDTKQVGDKRSLFWDDQEASGTGTSSTYNVDASLTVLGVGTGAGKRTRQTFRRFNYQPGKSQLIMMTGILDTSGGGTGVIQRIGYFDDDNGVFFQNNEGTKQVVVRSNSTGSVVNSAVDQDDWNIDQLDGTGPSGITVDWTKTQIFFIDFEWLGVGLVRYGIQLGGDTYYFHIIEHAGVDTLTYMGTPNLPARYEIEQLGTGTAATLTAICCSILSEGGQNPTGILRSESTDGVEVATAVANTIYAVVGIKLKAAFNGIEVTPKSLSMLSEAAQADFEWRLLLNPTVAGTFTFGDLANSAVQTAVGAVANTVTNGTLLRSGWAKSNTVAEASAENEVYALGTAIDGTLDEIVLCVRPLANNVNIQGTLNWIERL